MKQIFEGEFHAVTESKDPQKKVSFSKLSKEEKLNHVCQNFTENPQKSIDVLKSFWHQNADIQKCLDEFSENTISNYPIPFGIVPNVLINDKNYFVPMTIEESSVVAAAAKSAKYWKSRGGFKAEVISTLKVGQVHFKWTGSKAFLEKYFKASKETMLENLSPIVHSMEKRGGGLRTLELLDKTELEDNYYQLKAEFETCDAMGANFINTVLESLASQLKDGLDEYQEHGKAQIIMAILSNYTPDCLVRVEVSCSLDELEDKSLGMEAREFAEKFATAVRIAEVDPYRATTHNKGIFNGIDAVVMATGNDFRAVEACGHSYAARSGQYKSLTKCNVSEDKFSFSIEIPLALGTVGGLTSLHPLSRLSLEILDKPNAEELMIIAAAVGLAQNFGAVRSLVTTGIQKGHMKMHLMNILNHLGATELEREDAKIYFENRIISFTDVKRFLAIYREYQ